MAKMTPEQIQEINRRMIAGTYVHEPEPEPEPEEKPKRGRSVKAKQAEQETAEGLADE